MEFPFTIYQMIKSSLPNHISVLANAIMKLYFADKISDKAFKQSNVTGVLTLVIDRKSHCFRIKIFDIDNLKQVFDIKLYKNFAELYNGDNLTFHYFPINEGWVGMLYKDDREALNFKDKIDQFASNKDPSLAVEDKKVKKDETQANEEFQKEKIYINRAFFKKSSLYQDVDYNEFMNPTVKIGIPTKLEQKSYGGWDPINQLFNIEELPEEVKNLLKSAGIKKKDLKDKNIALAVYEILNNPNKLETIIKKQKAQIVEKQKTPKKKEDEKTKEKAKDEESKDNKEETKEINPLLLSVKSPPVVIKDKMPQRPKSNFIASFKEEFAKKQLKPVADTHLFDNAVKGSEKQKMKLSSALHVAIVERKAKLGATNETVDENDDW